MKPTGSLISPRASLGMAAHYTQGGFMSIGSENTARRGRILAVLSGGFLFLAFLFLTASSAPVSAQGNPSATPQPTVNPTIVALEERIKTLEIDVQTLQKQRDAESLALQLQIQKALLPVYIGGLILIAFGISTVWGLMSAYRNFTEKTKKQLEEDTYKKLDQAFYNADPLYYPLYVPASGFDLEIRRLKKLGFKDLRKYGALREGILNGVIVVRIPGENFRNNSEDQDHAETALKAFEKFVVETKANEKNVAFVLYITGGQLDRASEVVAKYDNVVIANMPVTVAGHVYALVRGLTALDREKDDK
jgi:hypothetical protein